MPDLSLFLVYVYVLRRNSRERERGCAPSKQRLGRKLIAACGTSRLESSLECQTDDNNGLLSLEFYISLSLSLYTFLTLPISDTAAAASREWEMLLLRGLPMLLRAFYYFSFDLNFSLLYGKARKCVRARERDVYKVEL